MYQDRKYENFIKQPSPTALSLPQASRSSSQKLISQPSPSPVQSHLPMPPATRLLPSLPEKKNISTSSSQVKRSSTAQSATLPSKNFPKKLNSISSSTQQLAPQPSANLIHKSTSVTLPNWVTPSSNSVHPIAPDQSDLFSVAEQPVQPPQSITLQPPLTSKESSKKPSVTLQAPLTSKELSKEPSVTLQQPLTSLEH